MSKPAYPITEHVHRFAAWAASRAASRGAKGFTVEVGKDLIETAKLHLLSHFPHLSIRVEVQPSTSASLAAEIASEERREIPTVELWEEVHELLVNITLLLVVLHIGGVLMASFSHKENLLTATLDGKKSAMALNLCAPHWTNRASGD